MSKLVSGDGRTHIVSSLMRESLVDKRIIAKTQSDREYEIMPDVALVSIGGQSIFDRGKAALFPLVAELAALRSKHKLVLGVGGGTARPAPGSASRSTSACPPAGLRSSSERWKSATPSS